MACLEPASARFQSLKYCLLLAFLLDSSNCAKANGSGILDASPKRELWEPLQCSVRNVSTTLRHNAQLNSQFRSFRQQRSVDGDNGTIIYCKDGDTYRALGDLWTKGCLRFQCTRNGITPRNQTYSQCQFLNSTVQPRQKCRVVLVQDGDNECCQGLECRWPEVPTSGASNCPPEWSEVNVTGLGAEANSACLKYSLLERTYDAAAKDCRSQMASLINLKVVSSQGPVLLSLKNNLSNFDITEFWTGLHTREHYYYWDDFVDIKPDSYVDACRNNNGSSNVAYGWECGEPRLKGACVKARYLNDTIVLSSVNCGHQLHYVCLKYSSTDLLNSTCIMAGTSACLEGWLFSPDSKKCYKFFDKRKNAFEAMVTCQDVNATLSRATDITTVGIIIGTIPDDLDTVPREIHAGVCLGKTLDQCTPTNPPLRTHFDNGTLIEWHCTAINNLRLPWNTNNYQDIEFYSCYRPLPFVCEKLPSGPTLGGLTVDVRSADPPIPDCGAQLGTFNACGRRSYSWIVDGLFLHQIGPREQAAYACYATDVASGERIYSPIRVLLGPGQTDAETLRFSTRLRLSSVDVCRDYSFGGLPSEIRPVVYNNIFFITSVTDRSGEQWTTEELRPVACRPSSSSTEVIVVAEAMFYKLASTRGRQTLMIRDTPNSQIQIPKLPQVDELSNVIESELRRAWYIGEQLQLLAQFNITMQVDHISVRSLRFCNTKTIFTKEIGNITIPRNAVDSWFNVSLCISTRRPLLAMYCQPNFIMGASWTAVIESQCPDAISGSELALKRLLTEPINEFTVNKVFSSAVNIANNSNEKSGMTTSEIIDTSYLVKNALDAFADIPISEKLTLKITETIPAIVSQVMRAPKEHIWQAEIIAKSSSLLTQSLDHVADKMLSILDIANENATIKRTEDNVAIQVTRDPIMTGIGVFSTGVNNKSQLIEIRSDNNAIANNFTAQITISPHARKTGKSFIMYTNNKLFKGRIRNAASDIILSASLETRLENFRTDDLIRAQFTNRMGVHSDALECGFWSYDENDWSTDGCKKIRFNDEAITCYCDHTTSFATLLRVQLVPPDDAHEKVLDVLTTVGLSISIASLLIVLVTFIIFKKMRQTLSQKVLFNLSLALCFLDVTFLVGIDRAENETACIIFAVLLHYLLLSSFAWMAVEAVLQYLRFVKVIGAYVPRFILKASIPAWGAPAIIVGIICVKDYREYLRGGNICWVNETVLNYGVLLPIAIIIAFNSIVFGLIMRSLFCQKNTALRTNQSEMQMMRLHLRAAIAVFVVMGLTWTFGFLMIQQSDWFGIIFQYLFCIFNSLQGLLIFCFHCAREKTVIDAWKNVFGIREATSKTEDFSLIGTRTLEHRGANSADTLDTDVRFDSVEDTK